MGFLQVELGGGDSRFFYLLRLVFTLRSMAVLETADTAATDTMISLKLHVIFLVSIKKAHRFAFAQQIQIVGYLQHVNPSAKYILAAVQFYDLAPVEGDVFRQTRSRCKSGITGHIIGSLRSNLVKTKQFGNHNNRIIVIFHFFSNSFSF